MFTKIKICTSSTDPTSNGYYSEVMARRKVLCLQQGRDESTEAYYQRFEVAISTSELAKTNGKTYMKLNKTYAGGNDENGTKRFQAMHLLMSTNSEL